MKRPSINKVSQHWLDIFDWVNAYVKDEDDVYMVTRSIYHLSSRNAKHSFVAGLLIGGFAVLLVLAWIN
jgi:hypothetical protein